MRLYKDHSEKLNLLRSGKLDLVANVIDFLNRVNENKDLNAFNFVFDEEAVKDAEKVSEKIKTGNSGKLAGMVIAVKDVIAIKDKPLTCSSKILRDFTSLYDSEVVSRLKNEDAIIIGKTNCDEFAMGSSNENSAFGSVQNPVDRSRVPGGSSGGSAAAVAANLCDAALGTDTGGSIRQPAAFCGIYGLKPSYGRVSRYGLTSYASGFDVIGPMTNSVSDAALILSVIAGKDEKDSTCSDNPVPSLKLEQQANPVTIGLPKEYYAEGLDEEIKDKITAITEKLKKQGHSIKEVSLPMTDYTIAAYYILATAEASSNLARYDGARYGYRSTESRSLSDMYVNSRTEGFGEEVKRRIMLGTYVLSSGYYDAYYKKAQKVRRLIKEDFDRVFSEVDILLTPTTPTPPFRLGEKTDDPLTMYLNDIYTVSANLAGVPGLSIPAGFNSDKLPVGVQLLAPQFSEDKLLNFAKTIESL